MSEQGFEPYDRCLTCGRRVGAHAIPEFEDCLAAKGRYGDDEE